MDQEIFASIVTTYRIRLERARLIIEVSKYLPQIVEVFGEVTAEELVDELTNDFERLYDHRQLRFPWCA